MHKKFGFNIEGVYKKQIYRDGVYIDVYRIALFSTKWKEIRNNLISSLGIKE
jgi:RimJ/RimL family protein N-acetyltransferase